MSMAEKLTTVAANQEKVYEAGQQSAYDRFWDVYQQNGKRTDYRGCFGGAGWTWELFRPKYDLKPAWGAGSDMFRGTQLSGSLKQHLSNIGIALDCSEMINATAMFYSTTTVTETPDLNFGKCTSLNMTFYGCTALESCKIIVSAACTNYNNAFANCTALTNLTIEGEIAATLDLKSCPLSRASILSVYHALSATKTGQTLSLNKAAVEAAFTTEEWNAMKAAKSNWTLTAV